MKILITSGGTKIKIDRVRDITNMSTGTFGSKIAYEFMEAGHEVVFLKAKGSKSPVRKVVDLANTNWIESDFLDWFHKAKGQLMRYTEYEYTTFAEYSEHLQIAIKYEKPDIIVLAAAVSDYEVANFVDGKIRSNDSLTIQLAPLPKLINKVKEWAPKAKLVGFKLLVNSTDEELVAAAKRSIANNGCDLVVANDLRDIKNNNHRLHIVSKNSVVIHETDAAHPNYLAQMVVQRSVAL